MDFENSDSGHNFHYLDKIIGFAKWMWNLERSETGIINTIFAVILFAVVIISCVYFKEEIFTFLLIIIIIILLGYSLITVSKTEQAMEKLKRLTNLEKKYKI